jgi:hypothetical protein
MPLNFSKKTRFNKKLQISILQRIVMAKRKKHVQDLSRLILERMAFNP